MHILKKLILVITIILSTWFSTQASFVDNFWWWAWAPTVRFCESWECGTQEGIEVIKESLSDIETERSASEYIQDIVQYLLTFIAIIAVIYIMYAWFNIMIWNGDEEKLKKSRQTIVYVLLWIVVIFLAWPITLFILRLLNVT